MKDTLKKSVDIIAYSKELNKFIRYLLYPAVIEVIEEQKRNDGKKVMVVSVRNEDKGIAIGKSGRNITKVNIFVKRHFDVDSVIINT